MDVDIGEHAARQQLAVQLAIESDAACERELRAARGGAEMRQQVKDDPPERLLQRGGDILVNLLDRLSARTRAAVRSQLTHEIAPAHPKAAGIPERVIGLEQLAKARGVAVRRETHDLVFIVAAPPSEHFGNVLVEEAQAVALENRAQTVQARAVLHAHRSCDLFTRGRIALAAGTIERHDER